MSKIPIMLLVIFAFCGCNRTDPVSVPSNTTESEVVLENKGTLRRKVLEGEALGDWYEIRDTFITLWDTPIIVVYISIEPPWGARYWKPLPIVPEIQGANVKKFYITSGMIVLVNCNHYDYKVVMIK